MFNKLTHAMILGLLMISIMAVQGGTLHVPGDYATIQAAIDAASDGDIILVAPGTYNISSNILNNRVNHLQLLGSREEDGSNASIIYAAVDPGRYNGIFFDGVSGCVISGFEVTNAHSGITLHYCTDCIVTRNYLHDNDEATSFHGNGLGVFFCENIDITYNIFDHNEFHGIQLCYGNRNINIINNTILNTYRYDGIVLDPPFCDNVTIKNNIIAYHRQEGIEIRHTFLNFVHDYNCFWQNGSGPIRPPHTIGAHSMRTDPLIVDIANHNYYLQPGSPCIGTGEGGVDIGALGVLITNHPPFADAGTDLTVEATAPSGAVVILDGSGSSDPDDDPLTYIWKENGVIIAGPTANPTAEVTLGLGTHTIELTVDDSNGGLDTDEVIIEVQDSTPPEISVTLDPDILWPPNHKMAEIKASVTVTDGADPSPYWELFSVLSNESEVGPGRKHYPDIMEHETGTPDTEFQLRAERLGTGGGRIYTITYRAIDASGNSMEEEATVVVPHDMGKRAAGFHSEEMERPDSYRLFSNYPNPFNPVTTIAFALPEQVHVTLRIYNTRGELMATLVDETRAAGTHIVMWDAAGLGSGVYFYRIDAGSFSQIRKCMLTK